MRRRNGGIWRAIPVLALSLGLLAGCSDNDITGVGGADNTAPTIPTGLTATAVSPSQINLSWTASTDSVGVTGYNVYRGGSLIGTSATTSYSDKGLSPSTTCTYTVSAYDAAGNTSAQSSSASDTTHAAGGGSGTPWKSQIRGVGSGGGGSSEWGRGIATDAAGNVYVAGLTYGTLPGSPTVNPGGTDPFLVKYNPAGDNVWTRQIGSTSSDSAYAVAVDNAGNIYVAGTTGGTLPGSPTPNQGNGDIFLVKYNPSGDNVWTRQIGSTSGDSAYGVAVDTAGNVYVAGTTGGTLPGSPTPNQGGSDIILVKYNPAGDNVWTRQTGSTGDEYVSGVAVDGTGNIYVTGSTYGTLPGCPTNRGSEDLFLVKFNPAGDNVWARQMGSGGQDSAYAVALDSAGNVYVAGYTGDTLPGSPTTSLGWGDIFLVKFNPAGDNVWTRQMGSTFSCWAQGVAVDAAGNIYLAGGAQGALPGSPTPYQGGDDIVVVKYNSAGDNVWTRQMGSTADEFAWAVAVDGSGNVFMTGETWGSLDGAPKAGNDWDIFLLKYLPDGTGP